MNTHQDPAYVPAGRGAFDMSDYNSGHKHGYYIGVTDGERIERAAIVAWLRDFGNPTSPALPLVADAIERGEHLDADDE